MLLDASLQPLPLMHRILATLAPPSPFYPPARARTHSACTQMRGSLISRTILRSSGKGRLSRTSSRASHLHTAAQKGVGAGRAQGGTGSQNGRRLVMLRFAIGLSKSRVLRRTQGALA